MRRFTTPTLPLTAEGLDLTEMDYVWVSISDKEHGLELLKGQEDFDEMIFDGEDTLVYVTLTQEETGAFIANTKADVQINFMKDKIRDATEIKTICVKENLLKRVMPEEVEPNG